MLRALTEDEKGTLEFLKEYANRAMLEQANGDPSLMNSLAKKSDAFGYWFINVATRGVVSPEQFAVQQPSLMREAARLQKEFAGLEAAAETPDRLAKLEESMKKLEGLPDAVEKLLKYFDDMAAKATSKGKKPAEETTEAE